MFEHVNNIVQDLIKVYLIHLLEANDTFTQFLEENGTLNFQIKIPEYSNRD